MESRKLSGTIAEDIACQYLISHGFTIIQRNYACKYGEIDIICAKRDSLIFVEVRSRYSSSSGDPYESIGPHKLRKVMHTAYAYIYSHYPHFTQIRLDCISIIMHSRRLKHFKNVTF